MDIAGMSMQISQASVVQAASLAMAKKTMDLQEATTASLLQMMQSTPPSFGHRLDTQA